MSYNKNNYSNRRSTKGTFNVKPYNKKQSILNRVKDAMQGYFTPSWVQALFPPGNDQKVNKYQDTADHTERNGDLFGSLRTETSEARVTDAQISTEALNEGSTSILKRRLPESYPSDEMERSMLAPEPQSKRRALEKNVEFVEEDVSLPSTSLKSTPIARPSLRSLRSYSPVLAQSITNINKSSSKNTSLYSLSNHKSSEHTRLPLTSPFYNGPVAYGGANSHSRQTSSRSSDNADNKDHHVLVSKRQSNLGLSKTTQRILKVIESHGARQSDSTGLPPLMLDLEKEKLLMTEVFHKDKKIKIGPPAKQFQTPSQLSIKPNFALMNCKSSNIVEGSIQDNKTAGWTGKIRREREKLHEIRSHDVKSIEEVEENNSVDLSHIKLPPIKLTPLLTSSTTIVTNIARDSNEFKFSSPCLAKERRHTDVNSLEMDFTFSEPMNKSFTKKTPLNFETLPISQQASSLANFQVDFNVAVRKTSEAMRNEGLTIAPAKEIKTGSVMDILKKNSDISHCKPKEVSLKELFKTSSSNIWQCPMCMVQNQMELTTCPCCLSQKPTATLPTSTSSPVAPSPTESSTSAGLTQTCKNRSSLSLSSLFAAKMGEWDCGVCMVRNKTDAAKCAACETVKPSNTQQTGCTKGLGSTPLKNLSQDKWKCDNCFVENINSILVCPCCNEARPSFNADTPVKTSNVDTLPSLSSMFASKPGEWSCAECMVKNKADVSKCVACETVKPGSQVASASMKNDCALTSVPSQISVNAGTGGFSFGSALNFKTSHFGDNSKSEVKMKQETNTPSGGFKPSFGFQSSALPTSSTGEFSGFGGGFKFSSSALQSTITCSTATSKIQTSTVLATSSSTPSAALDTPTNFQSSSNGMTFNFGQPINTTSKDRNLNNSNPFLSIKSSNDFSAASRDMKDSVVSSTQFGSKDLSSSTFGFSSQQAVSSSSVNKDNTSASGFTFKAQETKLPPFQFGLPGNPNVSSAVFPSLTNPSIAFGQTSSNNTITSIGTTQAISFGQNSSVASSGANFTFGSTPLNQKPSIFASNTNSCGSGFPFKNSTITPGGLFGNTKESVGISGGFNVSTSRTSTNGDDMMVESPQATQPTFGSGKTVNNNTAFNFGSNNGIFGAGNVPQSQGFSFSSAPSTSFNFSQIPSSLATNQQTAQWGQQSTTAAQPFNFSSTPTMNFSSTPSMNFGANEVAFSAGGTQGGRVIKKAVRRIGKK